MPRTSYTQEINSLRNRKILIISEQIQMIQELLIHISVMTRVLFRRRVVFFKPMHVREYSSTDITDCLDEKCPTVGVIITGGNSTDSDCVSRAYPKYQQESSDASIVCILLQDKILYIWSLNLLTNKTKKNHSNRTDIIFLIRD